MSKNNLIDLLNEEIEVVNVGLDGFVDDLNDQGVKVSAVNWTPPAGGDQALADLLSKLGT